MNKEILPAILEKKFEKIKNKIYLAKKNNFKIVQIDICDGFLVPSKTFSSNLRMDSLLKMENEMKKNKIFYEFDLFIKLKNREKIINDFKKLKNLKRIVFHYKSVNNWEFIFNNLKNKKIGLGIWFDDENKKVLKILKNYPFDYIQIMGIEKVGFGGQKINIKKLKNKISFFQKNTNLKIQIDGGVKKDNLKKLILFGASSFVMGSGFYKSKDLKKRKKELIDLIQ